ncbi:hypothetical protein Tco_1330036, partial [Tanacetum coccineum]
VNTPGSDENRLKFFDLMFIEFMLVLLMLLSSNIPADYVSAGHVLVPADSDRIC